VVGGTHLAPAEGATWEAYDPFQPTSRVGTGHKRLAWEAPYVAFLELDLRDHEAAAAWANQFGLLGILTHRTVELNFWPEWVEVEEELRELSYAEFLPHQGQYGADLGFREIVVNYVPEGVEPSERGLLSSEEARDFLSMEERFREWIRPPGVVVQDLWDGELTERDLLDGFALFFPKIDGVVPRTAHVARGRGDSFPLPVPPIEDLGALKEETSRRYYDPPFSHSFVQDYAEPLFLLEEYQRCLWEIGEDLRVNAEQEASELPYDRSLTTRLALGGIQPIPLPQKDTKTGKVHWVQGWNLRSLFAAMVQMMVRDLLFKRRHLRQCEWCSQLFLAKHPSRKYCSPGHRKNAQMRGYRERQRKTREKNV